MGAEIYLVVGAYIIIALSYYQYNTKAKFQNGRIGGLILYRSLISMVYVTLFYYLLFVWKNFSALYLIAVIASFIVFNLLDRQIKKEANKKEIN